MKILYTLKELDEMYLDVHHKLVCPEHAETDPRKRRKLMEALEVLNVEIKLKDQLYFPPPAFNFPLSIN